LARSHIERIRRGAWVGELGGFPRPLTDTGRWTGFAQQGRRPGVGPVALVRWSDTCEAGGSRRCGGGDGGTQPSVRKGKAGQSIFQGWEPTTRAPLLAEVQMTEEPGAWLFPAETPNGARMPVGQGRVTEGDGRPPWSYRARRDGRGSWLTEAQVGDQAVPTRLSEAFATGPRRCGTGRTTGSHGTSTGLSRFTEHDPQAAAYRQGRGPAWPADARTRPHSPVGGQGPQHRGPRDAGQPRLEGWPRGGPPGVSPDRPAG